MKGQNGDYRKEVKKIEERLKDTEESIDIIARRMASQEKRHE